MDEYEKKLADMQKYIPFLEKIIERLQNVTDRSREDQLKKMQHLHGILTGNKRQLRIEALQNCEGVLQRLHRIMGKRTSAGVNVAVHETEAHSSGLSNALSSISHKTSRLSTESQKVMSSKKMDETPASPSPPASPDMTIKSVVANPIMIPTERTHDYSNDKMDSKPASPDASETVATKEPIIIPTERKDEWSEHFQPDEIPRNSPKTKSHQKLTSPVTSSASSSRRFSLAEKTRVEVTCLDNVLDVIQIDSPTKSRFTSTESRNTSKKNPTSLLASPPPELNAPPLSMEDLAELLDESTESNKTSSSHGEKEIRSRSGREKIQEELKRTGSEKKPNKKSASDCTNPDAESERRWEEVDKHIVKLTTRKSLASPGTLASVTRTEASKADIKSSSSSNHGSKSKKSGDNRNPPVSPSTKNLERNAEPRYTDNYERYPRYSRENQTDIQTISMPDMNVIKSAFSSLSEGDIANLVQTNLQIQTKNFLHSDDRNPSLQRRATIEQHQQRSGPPAHIGPAETDFRRENSEFYDMHQQTSMHHQPGVVGYPAAAQWAPNQNMRGHIHGTDLSPRQYQHPNNVPHQDVWNMAPNPVPLDGPPQHHIPNRGIRSLMSPQSDRAFMEDIPLSPPPPPPPLLIPSLMASPTFPNPQYRGFPAENRSFEQPFERTSEFQHGQPRQQWDHQPNRGNDLSFDRPSEYSHIPPGQPHWDPSPNRANDVPYDQSAEFSQSEYSLRPTQWEHETNYHDNSRTRGMNDNYYSRTSNVEPQLWGRGSSGGGGGPDGSNRNNERGRGNDRFPNERNRPGEPSHGNFVRARPSEWDRPPQNESSNRYRDRDPRCRTEPNVTQSTNASTSTAIPRRDPRLSKDTSSQQLSLISKAKETPTSTPITKPKDTPTISKRDPRRRSVDIKDAHKLKNSAKSSYRSRSRSSDRSKDTSKHSTGKPKKHILDHKSGCEKLSKDVETMQSPLESLYGVIDTTAKTGKGYGLQKFKIPKIRRPEPTMPRPPTPPKPSRHVAGEEEWTAEPAPCSITDSSDKSKIHHDEKKAEVTSTTEEIADLPMLVSSSEGDETTKCSEVVTTSKELLVRSVDEHEKTNDKVLDVKSTVAAPSNMSNSDSGNDIAQETQMKDSVTQELIEALIRKSLESGEAKKLFEQAKLLQRLVDPKKYKKIEKIINGDSESGSSDKEVSTIKKSVPKKKRRVIVSDSSDEECLADRLGITMKRKRRRIDTTKKITYGNEESDIEETEPKQKDEHEEEEEAHYSGEDGIVNAVENTVPKKQKKTRKVRTKRVTEMVVEQLEEPKEVLTKPPGKIAKKRRNSLEMLQEDIREMFISEGVVTATGHRMCRVIKEAEGNFSSIRGDEKVETGSIPISSSPERHNNVQTDEDEPSQKVGARNRARTTKNSDVEVSPKSRLRSRRGRRRAAKISKGVILSSDSEAERISTRDETGQQCDRQDSDTSVATVKNHNLIQSTSLMSDATDDFGPILRRSERVAMKEPRVLIEKADLSKIDSSKIMFDTSSDESFGIDVSELTAAVDISLHSERQTADDSNDTISGSLKKVPDKAIKSRKKNSNESNDCKRNTPVAFDDDNSMISDISTLSILSEENKKKLNTVSHLDTNKELIVAGVGNLSDDKVKNTINTNSDKHSDGEMDEEKDVSTTDDNKKPQSKVKKKRCRWQMGFVPKGKKKKSGNSVSVAETTAAASDENIVSSPVERTGVEGVSVVCATNIVDLDSNVIENEGSDTGKINLSRRGNNGDSPGMDDKNQSPKSQVKVEKQVTEVYKSLDLNEIIEYAWTGQERYKCLLCQFSGKNIVHHYKINHSGQEIMISRLTLLDAKRAIDEAKDETFIKLSNKVNSGPRRKFSCRFCAFTNEGVKKPAMENFYEHCTTHTGEYRFSCRNCGYQTISRASMKPHYYKVCRKSAESFAVATVEDSIPLEQYIAGYLCSICNYIQLKECNIKAHVATAHENLSDVEIIRINMSGYFDVKDNEELNHPFDEAISLKTELDMSFAKQSDKNLSIVGTDRVEDNSDIEILDRSTDEIENVPQDPTESISKIIQDESDNPPSNKLNVFVCPPELEDKEVEIELERKKMMQDILNNMGRNFQKPLSDEGLSIIDKLKNKMTTNLNSLEWARVKVNDDEGALVQQVTSESRVSELHQSSDNFEGHNELSKSELVHQDSILPLMNLGEEFEGKIPEEREKNTDKAEKKIKDPLTSLQNDEHKDDNSDNEASDNEPIADVSRSYESDSSEEMSDTELPADVHSLLEAAGTINSLTNVPMMTTIQRLAAQLQSAKNFAAVNNDTIDEENCREDQRSVDDEVSQHAAAYSRATTNDSKPNDSTNEPSSPVPALSEQSQTDDGRKNFIRLRRLSGDKLSIQEPSLVSRTPSPKTRSASVDENFSELSSTEVLTTMEDECSFLKIENVISLAPTVTNTGVATVLGDDMRTTVSTPTGKTIVSVLKKLRPVGTLEGLIGRLPPIAPAPPKCFKLSNIPPNKNVKIVKILNSGKPIRELTSLKQKDSGQSSSAPKLKTVEAYANMLAAPKLRHLYKCMARSCEFSSDSVEAFGRHFQNHINAVDRTAARPPHDFEKCAYCSDSLSTWEEMRSHFKMKHTFCSFQCSYCFYRAFTQSYVELHQNSSHPGKPTSVILGMKDYHPSEMIDKREHVIPIVCKHECNKIFYVPEAFVAHLRSKHGPALSIFKCHICPTTTLKAEQLISHYKLHGIYKYQCLYCLFGADGPMELHHHLSLMHCNRPPKILERSLPPEPVRDKDVLLQLIIRNLDATFKCSELKIISDTSNPDNFPKLTAKRRKRSGPNADPGEIVLSGNGKSIKILPAPVKPVSHEVIDLLESGEKSSSPQRNDIFINLADTLRAAGTFNDSKKLAVLKLDGKSPGDALSKPSITVRLTENLSDEERNSIDEHNIPDNSSMEQSIHQEPELELRYASEQLKSKIANAIDPLSFCESDEFININFLDNPEILKSVEQSAVQKDVDQISKITEDIVDDDSDIEILEHIQHTDDNSRHKTVPKALPDVEVQKPIINKEENEENKKGLKHVESEKKLTVVGSSGENSNTVSDINPCTENTEIKEKSHAPLTLRDIKDTGFTGRDLYKCGYAGCTFSTLLATSLKNHIKQCVHANERREFSCIHCTKRFVKVAYLLEHLKIHGLKRFGCSVCSSRFAIPHQAISHMKFRHKVHNSKLIPADPTNPSADGLFVIHPHKGVLQKYRGKKGGKSKSSDKKRGKDENITFSPADIDALPRQPIYNHEVQCAICPYKTKVRSNIIRHLQLHAKDETVPESGPVNPVPCLDKKERMFDKMVNLASSSHQNGRMGGTVKETTITASELDGLPKYVPEQKRYVCGVADCNYLTVDETMLRYHSKALHPDEVNFRCPHCPSQSPGQETPQTIPIDKMGVHLKMHDTRLYKCSHCNHHHYHRHVVERHMTDKHAEQRPYVKIIREIENTENSQQSPAQEEPEEGPADRDGNYWKCNLCDYKCVYKSEMVIHAGSVHGEKAQFKCSLCIFKTTARISLEQHIMSKHVNDPDCTYLLAFERIKGPKPTSIEPTQVDEPFDTTPLWRRDMPRVRHIRGILLEEESETSCSIDMPTKSVKRKNDGELSTKTSKIKVKSVSTEGSIALDNKGKSETKGERIDNAAGTTRTTASSPCNQVIVIPKLNTEGSKLASGDSSETALELGNDKYGTYVEPNGNFYVCSLCPNYKSKFRQDIKDHLYRELKYWRWHCKTCGFLTVSQSLLTKHINRQHKDTKVDYVAIKPNPEIESWVQTFLSKQLAVMRGVTKSVIMQGSNPPNLNSSTTRIEVRGKPPTITLEDIVEVPVVSNKTKNSRSMLSSVAKRAPTETPSAMPSSTISASETGKTVDLTQAISSLQAMSSTHIDIDSDYEDDGDALVIDSKDDSVEENKDVTLVADTHSQSNEKGVQEQTYVCKHCDMKFSRWRGFKLHVQVNHLKRLGFLCPYCDRSTNSETMMRQHIRTKHIGRPESIVHNPAAGGPELSDAFWEQEYGLIRPKKVKKRKLKRPYPDTIDPPEDSTGKIVTTETCTICGFSALNFTGLKVHMRAHVNKNSFKCVHCSFTTNSKSEVWQHSEINHPNMEWRAQEINSAGSLEDQPIHQYIKTQSEEDYSEDIEEETMPEAFEHKIIHGCFYCNLRSASLDSVKKHWALVHKDLKESSEHKTGVPFRYKEIPVKTISQHKLMKCAYCPKKGSLTMLRAHCRKKHSNVPLKFTEAIDRSQDIWVCKWCDESCEANARTAHHNMFHSHLPVRFRKEHDMQVIQKGYVCPECRFVSVSLSRMKTHVAKHYDTFRCKRCDGSFPSIVLATQHSTREHPGLSANIEGFATNIDLIMARVSETDCAGIVSNTTNDVRPTPSNDIFRNLGVAKKSTTKQSIRSPTTSPSKSVARKSTNPLPRYPPGLVFNIDNIFDDCDNSTAKSVSHYGLPKEFVDLSNLNTTMAVGGAQMTVKCNTLAQIINIEPCVVLKDIKKFEK